MKHLKKWLGATLILALSASLPALAKYPERPIRLIVPFPAGGSTDVLARVVAKNMSLRLGQSVIVDNKSGAATTIGVDAAAKSTADGYTILLGTATSFSMNPYVFKKLPYRLDDFVPIGFIAEAPVVLVTSNNVTAKNLDELVAGMKSAKEEVAVATTGRGGFSHLTASMFFNAIGVKFRDVPYRGEAPAIQDLLSSSVNYYFGNLPGSLPHVTSGKIRAFAVTSTARSPAAPTIPSFTELGRAEVVANAWFGLMAPKGTPAEVVAALADALNKAHDDKELQARLASDGATAKRMRPEEFAEYMKRDNERWARVVKAANIDGLEP